MNACFSEIFQEVKQLQMKVLDFVEKEEAAALGKLGSSIQQSHNRLLKLEGDSIWLRTLLANKSDQQFLQASCAPSLLSLPQALTQTPLPLHPQTPQICSDLGLSHQHLGLQLFVHSSASGSLPTPGRGSGAYTNTLGFYF